MSALRGDLSDSVQLDIPRKNNLHYPKGAVASRISPQDIVLLLLLHTISCGIFLNTTAPFAYKIPTRKITIKITGSTKVI